jgi:tetratricopeptide (TPR) repeat protein
MLAETPIDEIAKLYEQGLYLQAYERSKVHGPLADWCGAERQVLAGRLAANLGAPRLGRLLYLRAWRSAPADPWVCYFHAWGEFSRRGPLAAWKLLIRIGELPIAPPPVTADWCALHSHALGMLRDFDRAWHWLERADEIAPERPWVWVERSYILALEDRYAEALEAAEHAFRLHPWYRPAVEAVAEALQLVGRDREALDLLIAASERLESGNIVAHFSGRPMPSTVPDVGLWLTGGGG